MAEQLLDRAQVGAALEQVRRERVAQPVRVGDEAAQRRGVEPAAARREEERVLGAARELRARLAQVARDEARRLLAERHDAVLRALAVPDVDELLLEVDVAEVEPDRLGAAQAGRVDELDERAVAERERRRRRRAPSTIASTSACFGASGSRRGRRGASETVGHALRAEREAEQRRAPPRAAARSSPARACRRAARGRARPRSRRARARRRPRAGCPRRTSRRSRAGRPRRRGGSPRRSPAAARKRSIAASKRHSHSCSRATLRSPADGRPLVHASPSSPSTARTSSPARSCGHRRARPGRARARGRRGGLRARRDLRRRRLLRPVRQARADRARRPGDARLRARRGTAERMLDARRARGRAHRARRRRRPERSSTASTRRRSAATSCRGLKESALIVGERSTNWTIVPCPHPAWAQARLPRARRGRGATSGSGASSSTCCGSTSRTATAAWDERMALLKRSATRLTDAPLRRDRAARAGHRADGRLLPTRSWWAADFTTRDGLRHLPNLPTEEVFTTPDPLRTEGHVTSTKPLVLQDGTIVRGLRVRFEGGVAVEIDADENAEALRSQLAIDEGAPRLGELALVDRQGRIGPLGTIFYDTLLDENAASHIALGIGFPFVVEDDDVGRVNESGTPHRLHDRLARARGRRASRPPASACRCSATATGRSDTGARSPYHAAVRCRHATEALRMTATELPGRVDLAEHGIDATGARLSEPDDPAALHARAGARRGRARRGRPARRRHRPPHRPLAEGQVRRRRDRLRGPHLVGQGQPAARRGALRRPAREGRPRTSQPPTRSTSSTPSPAPTRRTGSACASSPRTRTTRCSRARCSSISPPDELGALRAAGARAARARPRGRPGGGRDAHRHVHRAASGPHRGADRRHVLRGRDQEVDLHGDERPAAARGRLPDALLGERRRRDGDVAIFFGLSGTGKTTLSADPERPLIGDDEHGWGDTGVFNFEGGCYAKVIRLSAEAEPEIFRTTHTFGTILENVVVDEHGVLDLDDDSKTENTRAAYKLEQISNALPAKQAGHPRTVVFLTADAFGILPPIARLIARAGALLLPRPASRRSSPAPRSASPSRSRRSRPASASRSCRSRRPSTRGCSARSSTRTSRPSGS